jgi:hypothetical protein
MIYIYIYDLPFLKIGVLLIANDESSKGYLAGWHVKQLNMVHVEKFLVSAIFDHTLFSCKDAADSCETSNHWQGLAKVLICKNYPISGDTWGYYVILI